MIFSINHGSYYKEGMTMNEYWYERHRTRTHSHSDVLGAGRFCIVTPRRDELLSRGLQAHGAAALDASESLSTSALRSWAWLEIFRCVALEFLSPAALLFMQ